MGSSILALEARSKGNVVQSEDLTLVNGLLVNPFAESEGSRNYNDGAAETWKDGTEVRFPAAW